MADQADPLLDLLLDEPDDELGRLLHELRWLVVRHPIATRAAFATLVEEGRRFASTSDGRAWRARLETSELLRRARFLLDVATCHMLSTERRDVLPSELIDAFCRAIARDDLDAAVGRRVEAPFTWPPEAGR
jgi:predicted aminopeptidase